MDFLKSIIFSTSLVAAVALAAGCSDDTAGTDGGGAKEAGAEQGADLGPDGGGSQAMLTQVVAWMTGSFSSEKQSKQDATYYNVMLNMKRIWPKATPGYWLYVEQAISGASGPYRQRVYNVVLKDAGTVESKVLDFKSETDRQAAAGSSTQTDPLSTLDKSDFAEKTGCSVFLKPVAGQQKYQGGTEGKGCLSTLSGATYASSRSTITEKQFQSWDQGFDSSDKQVWGAVSGPYIFDLIKDFDPDLDK